MTAEPWHFTLAWPPSVNHYYAVFKGRKILSKRGRDYQVTAAFDIFRQLGRTPKLQGSVQLTIIACPPDRRRRDLSNIIKAAEDCMVRAGLMVDDCQVDRLLLERAVVIPGGVIHVCVGPWENPHAIPAP